MLGFEICFVFWECYCIPENSIGFSSVIFGSSFLFVRYCI